MHVLSVILSHCSIVEGTDLWEQAAAHDLNWECSIWGTDAVVWVVELNAGHSGAAALKLTKMHWGYTNNVCSHLNTHTQTMTGRRFPTVQIPQKPRAAFVVDVECW